MDGLELAARFSYSPNSLNYCGHNKAGPVFRQYVLSKENATSAEKMLPTFHGLFPYLKTIAEKHGKHVSDYDVVEAYWIGNDLLNAFTKDDLRGIIGLLVESGLPKSDGQRLMKELPDGLFPHHLFQVMYVGVGRTTRTLPTTVENMDKCRPSWGEVIEVHGSLAIVKSQSLQMIDGKYSLSGPETKTAKVIPEFFPALKARELIALHWGYATVPLTDNQLERLQHYTNRTIDILNSLSH